jgi:hypothetical protein
MTRHETLTEAAAYLRANPAPYCVGNSCSRDCADALLAMRDGQPYEWRGDNQVATSNTLSELWLALQLLDCGDSSCRFNVAGAGGMRTNGGCTCFERPSSASARIALRKLEVFAREPKP